MDLRYVRRHSPSTLALGGLRWERYRREEVLLRLLLLHFLAVILIYLTALNHNKGNRK